MFRNVPELCSFIFYLHVVCCLLTALEIALGSKTRGIPWVFICVNLTRFSLISRGHCKHRTWTGIALKIFCSFMGISEINFTKRSNPFWATQPHVHTVLNAVSVHHVFNFVSKLSFIFKIVLRIKVLGLILRGRREKSTLSSSLPCPGSKCGPLKNSGWNS